MHLTCMVTLQAVWELHYVAQDVFHGIEHTVATFGIKMGEDDVTYAELIQLRDLSDKMDTFKGRYETCSACNFDITELADVVHTALDSGVGEYITNLWMGVREIHRDNGWPGLEPLFDFSKLDEQPAYKKMLEGERYCTIR